MHQWNSLLMLLAMTAGELTGQDDGSQIIGLQHRAKRALPGRSSMPLPLLLMSVWGTLWQRRKILIHCDNVVSVREKGTCKSPEIMALIHMLYFCAAHNNIKVYVNHISSVKNNNCRCSYSFSAPPIQKNGTKCQSTTRHHLPAWPQ